MIFNLNTPARLVFFISIIYSAEAVDDSMAIVTRVSLKDLVIGLTAERSPAKIRSRTLASEQRKSNKQKDIDSIVTAGDSAVNLSVNSK